MGKLAKEYNLDIILAFSFIVFIIIFLLFVTLHALGIIGNPRFIQMPGNDELRKQKSELSPSIICEKSSNSGGLEEVVRYTAYMDGNQLKYLDRFEQIEVTDIDEAIFAFEEKFEEIDDKVRNHNYFQGVDSNLIRDNLSLTYDKTIDYYELEIEGFTKRIGQPDGEVISFSIENNIKLNSTERQVKNHFSNEGYFCN